MEIKELNYEMAYKAVHGDREAQNRVLEYFDTYINALATVEEPTSDGRIISYVDEDLKAEIQAGYLEALPKCKAMK